MVTLQAISLIVTHRTDDMSKLPPVIPNEAPKARAKADKSGPRPRLRLLGAPAAASHNIGVSHNIATAASAPGNLPAQPEVRQPSAVREGSFDSVPYFTCCFMSLQKLYLILSTFCSETSCFMTYFS